MAPSKRKLHLSDEAYKLNEEMVKNVHLQPKRFQEYYRIENDIIDVHYHMDKEWYPVATVRVQSMLAMMQASKSMMYLPSISRIYEDLLESTYGKSVEVAELGLSLLFAQFPQLA